MAKAKDLLYEYWKNLKALVTRYTSQVLCVLGTVFACVVLSARLVMSAVIFALVIVPLAAIICRGIDKEVNKDKE